VTFANVRKRRANVTWLNHAGWRVTFANVRKLLQTLRGTFANVRKDVRKRSQANPHQTRGCRTFAKEGLSLRERAHPSLANVPQLDPCPAGANQ
jgi:hypothetical protein